MGRHPFVIARPAASAGGSLAQWLATATVISGSFSLKRDGARPTYPSRRKVRCTKHSPRFRYTQALCNKVLIQNLNRSLKAISVLWHSLSLQARSNTTSLHRLDSLSVATQKAEISISHMSSLQSRVFVIKFPVS